MTKKFFAIASGVLAAVLLTSCSLVSPLFGAGSTEQHVRSTAGAIVKAVNDGDERALKHMFTEYAQANYSRELDDGLDSFLALFSEGHVTLAPPHNEGNTELNNFDGNGHRTTLSGGTFDVDYGGRTFSLSFSEFIVNTIDPENVGIYTLSAVLKTAKGDSALELAERSWARVDDEVSAGSPPGVFVAAERTASDARMGQIVDALNGHDRAALRGMFAELAPASTSADIDTGIDYLLAVFSHGDVTWMPGTGGAGIEERLLGSHRAVLLKAIYTVSSGGYRYRFFFADFIENSIHPRDSGIYAIGTVPVAHSIAEGSEPDLYSWASAFDAEATNPPEIFK